MNNEVSRKLPTNIKSFSGSFALSSCSTSLNQSPIFEIQGHSTCSTKSTAQIDIHRQYGVGMVLKNNVVGIDKNSLPAYRSNRLTLCGCTWSFVFDPAGHFLHWWSAVVSISFLYNFWIIPYRYAFAEIDESSMALWFSLDYTCDLIYLVDICFRFRTAYLEEGVLQTSSRKMRLHYMNSTLFYIDFLCLLPLDFLYLSLSFKSIVRLFRLVKVYQFWNFLDRCERHTNFPNVIRSVKLLHYLIAIVHWNACVFKLVSDGVKFSLGASAANVTSDIPAAKRLTAGEAEVFGLVEKLMKNVVFDKSATFNVTDSTVSSILMVLTALLNIAKTFNSSECATHLSQQLNGVTDTWRIPSDFRTTGEQYLYALYWSSLTLTLMGDQPRPPTIGAYTFVIVEVLLALLLFSTVLGHVANIVANVTTARKDFQSRLDAVKVYLALRRVPSTLQTKVIKWFDYLWCSNLITNEERALSLLPDRLKAEIAIHVHLETLKRVEIFQQTEDGFLSQLVLRLTPALFSPGDYVCRKGEVGKEMYVVNRGRLHVVLEDGITVLATLRAGSYFGEISILNMGTSGNRRTASVKSVGYSDLFCLSKKDLWDVLTDYPAVRLKLEAVAVKRVQEYQNNPPKEESKIDLNKRDCNKSAVLKSQMSNCEVMCEDACRTLPCENAIAPLTLECNSQQNDAEYVQLPSMAKTTFLPRSATRISQHRSNFELRKLTSILSDTTGESLRYCSHHRRHSIGLQSLHNCNTTCNICSSESLDAPTQTPPLPCELQSLTPDISPSPSMLQLPLANNLQVMRRSEIKRQQASSCLVLPSSNISTTNANTPENCCESEKNSLTADKLISELTRLRRLVYHLESENTLLNVQLSQ